MYHFTDNERAEPSLDVSANVCRAKDSESDLPGNNAIGLSQGLDAVRVSSLQYSPKQAKKWA
jgi:hypothetical protein